jgi:hypothetical protein
MLCFTEVSTRTERDRWVIALFVLVAAASAIGVADAQTTQRGVKENSNLATPDQAAQPAALSSLPTEAIFLYGRANFFRALTKQLKCDLMDGPLFKTTNERFESARVRLASRYGEKLFSMDKPVGGPLRQGTCDQQTLLSYGNHVVEIERLLDKAE